MQSKSIIIYCATCAVACGPIGSHMHVMIAACMVTCIYTIMYYNIGNCYLFIQVYMKGNECIIILDGVVCTYPLFLH